MEQNLKDGIKSFIREVNPMLKVRFQDYDIECDIWNETIYIGKTYDKRTDDWFQDFVTELNPKTLNINPFLLALLHEIGHIETWDSDLCDERDAIYNLLDMQHNETQNDEEWCKMYFRIPLEQVATEWGIDFALSHMDLMKKYEWLHN